MVLAVNTVCLDENPLYPRYVYAIPMVRYSEEKGTGKGRGGGTDRVKLGRHLGEGMKTRERPTGGKTKDVFVGRERWGQRRRSFVIADRGQVGDRASI